MAGKSHDLARWWQLMPSGQVVVDERGLILQVNRTLSEWMHRPIQKLIGLPASELFTIESRILYRGILMYRVADIGVAHEVHLSLCLGDEDSLPVLCNARRLDQQGTNIILLSMLPIARKDRLERDLLDTQQATQRALAEKNAVIAELESVRAALEFQREELQNLNMRLGREARSDPLTGLPNRRHFDHALRQMLAGALTSHPHDAFSVAILDIDHFKPINDRYGHAAGDRVLKQLARLLSSKIRGRDLAARIGGEEFAFLMPDTPLNKASQALERLRLAIEAHHWHPVAITVSLGVTAFQHGDTSESLMARADNALYTAKRHGRNRIQEERENPA
ncbi:sensor domain-containing diguanylate cyclase [Chromohalobacter sp.]|uniref:GGDEF domain-containing protein n=1 Tax=Chromohalobacter sp. TaxID=50740 RepID=UPI0032424E74